MKKHIAVALLFALVLCGCSSGITQEEYDALVAQRDAAQKEIDVLNGQLDVYEQMLDEHDELISQRDTALAENEILRSQIAQYEQQSNGHELPATETAPETEQPTAPPAEAPDAPTTIENPELKTRGPITITKNPYGETVVEESRTWFIAHAENWDVVNWFFISPIDGKTYTVDEVRAMFPTFTLKSNSPDTISFVNIPLGFDGWQLYARFTNADGYVDTAKAEVEVVSYVDAYAPILADYDEVFALPADERERFVFSSGQDYRNGSLSLLCQYYDAYAYALIDLDDNGIKELIVCAAGEKEIFTIYTLVSGEPVNVQTAWERSHLYLLNDGMIYNEGSNSAIEAVYYLYRLEETKLVYQYGLWHTWNASHTGVAYYVDEDRDANASNDEELTEAQFKAKIEDYNSRIVVVA